LFVNKKSNSFDKIQRASQPSILQKSVKEVFELLTHSIYHLLIGRYAKGEQGFVQYRDDLSCLL